MTAQSSQWAMLTRTLPVVATLGQNDGARAWLAELPSLIDQVRQQWRLTLSPPLHGGSCSWVAPATRPDGSPAIVKIGWPHREMRAEPTALRAWAGGPAVQLLDHDPVRHALLLERCEPGTSLADVRLPAAQALSDGCAVLRELWAVQPAGVGEIEYLESVAAEWADLVDHRMERLKPNYDPGLVAEGSRLLRDLPRTGPRTVLLHGDFNPGNILMARRRTWLAIDPKPLIGDPAFDPWPLLEQVDDPFADPHPQRALQERVRLLAAELDLDRDRIVAWAVARRVDTALRAAHHADLEGGAGVMREARILAGL